MVPTRGPRSRGDERPPVWIGHTVLRVPDVERPCEFMVKVGMRPIQQKPEFAVLELRGGTHLVLLRSEEPVAAGTKAPFDLMVEDLEATRARYEALGLEPSKITKGRIHSTFSVVDPSGYEVPINSSHVVGTV